MRLSSLITEAAVALSSLLFPLQPVALSAGSACDPSDPLFVCGVERAEDLVRLGQTPWVIASDMTISYGTRSHVSGLGPLRAIRIDTRKIRKLYPTAGSAVRWDRASYPNCPAPPKSLSSHGLNVQMLSDDRFRLYVVNHGERESIEIIDVAVRGGELQATWRGCILAPSFGGPQGVWPNSVTPLANGAVALSGFHVAIWRPGRGWKQLDGPEFGVANGIEASRDGRWLFVADTTRRRVIRISASSGAESGAMKLDCFPDNLRWGDDGHLYVTGPLALTESPGNPGAMDAFAIAQIDPGAFTAKEIFRSGPRGIGGAFGNPTVALKVGSHIWVGSAHRDRVAILPLSH
jgi:hypothetical protein